jgi:hypothetical protein
MLNAKLEKILYVDPKDDHLDEENAIVIHPEKLSLADVFEKEYFDKIIIKNSPSETLKSKCFFNLARCLKERGSCHVYIYQPITVMQEAEAGEVEANAKLGGFVDIKSSHFEEWVQQGRVDVKIDTIKLVMVKTQKSK